MKNSTILKDELSLLKVDRSAVLTELKNKTQELKDIHSEVTKEENLLEEVRREKLKESVRLGEMRGRANSYKEEIVQLAQDAKNNRVSYDAAAVRNAQEQKLHLGRIKELKNAEKGCLDRISELKTSYDKSSDLYASHLSDKSAHLRELGIEIQSKIKELDGLTKEAVRIEESEKKATKDRLKREDKLRIREKNLEGKELSLRKKEDDLITMSKDMSIMYNRLKELYAKDKPGVDLDKLITKAI